MSESSGQYEREFTVSRVCEAKRNIADITFGLITEEVDCDFDGDVTAWYDPEISTAEIGWTCPTCGTEHREAKP